MAEWKARQMAKNRRSGAIKKSKKVMKLFLI